jgi:hypothetical protein
MMVGWWWDASVEIIGWWDPSVEIIGGRRIQEIVGGRRIQVWIK